MCADRGSEFTRLVGPSVVAAIAMITTPTTIDSAVPSSKDQMIGAAMKRRPARYSISPCAARGTGPWLSIPPLGRSARVDRDDLPLIVQLVESDGIGDDGLLGIQLEARVHGLAPRTGGRIGDHRGEEVAALGGQGAGELDAAALLGRSTLARAVGHGSQGLDPGR